MNFKDFINKRFAGEVAEEYKEERKMITFNEKIRKIEEFCDKITDCKDCPLYDVVDGENENCYTITAKKPANIERNYELIFGKQRRK